MFYADIIIREGKQIPSDEFYAISISTNSEHMGFYSNQWEWFKL